MYLSATPQDGLTHRLNYRRQFVTANVGMGINQDVLSSAMLDKNPKNTLHRTALLATGVEFTIAISSCPTLAKTIVALGVDYAFTLNH